MLCTLLTVCLLTVNILPSRATVASVGANCHPAVVVAAGTNGIGLPPYNYGATHAPLVNHRDDYYSTKYQQCPNDNINIHSTADANHNKPCLPKQRREYNHKPLTDWQDCKPFHLDYPISEAVVPNPDRRLVIVQRAFDLINELCDNPQPNKIYDILLLQRKLKDVREYLLAESQEISPSSASEATLRELDQCLTRLSTKIGNAISNYDYPMGFDVLSKIRHWLLPAGRSNAKDPPNIEIQNNETSRKRCYQAVGNENTADNLIKYRRVDNTFPKFMPNDLDDYNHMADSKQRKESENNSSTANATSQTNQKRLSMFNAPQTRLARVRNTHVTPIDLSDTEEQLNNESNMYQAFSDRLVVDVPTMSRDFGRVHATTNRPLYSDAVRYNISSYNSDLNYPRPSTSPSSSEARLNGHVSHTFDHSSAGKDNNILSLEDLRNERNQYINLINNLTLREHEPVPRRVFNASAAFEKPVTPPRLQQMSNNADDWLRSLVKNKEPESQSQLRTQTAAELEPRSNMGFNRSQYSKLLESKSKHQIDRQPLTSIGIKPPPALVKCYTIDDSTSSVNQSRNNLKPVITISDDDDYPFDNTVNRSQSEPSTSAAISRPLTSALKQRQSSCIYYSDDYTKQFHEKCARMHEQANNAKQLVIDEAKKSTEERQAYEQLLRESLSMKRFQWQSIFVLDNFKAKTETEPEIIPFTNEHQHRYQELVHGPSHVVLVSKFSLNITRNDICTLLGSCWLNDEIINFYMNLITDRSQINKSGKLPSVYAMNTFFIPRLLQNGHGAVKRWTRKVDLFSKDIIPVPVHVGGVHWCMAIIHMKNKTIRYYDSMGKPNQMVLNALEMYLRQESLDKRKIPFDTSDFKIENVQNVPQQTNGSDCGVFSCMFAEYITRNKPLTFSQENMEYFRKKMVLEICGGELWM